MDHGPLQAWVLEDNPLSMQRVAPLYAIDLLLLASLLFLFAVGVASVPDNPHRTFLHQQPPRSRTTMSSSSEQPSTKKAQKWFPLESNPVLMNDYIGKLGFHSDLYNFVDVFATEDWALEMIAKPVVAVIFLYPLTEKQLQHESGKTVAPSTSDNDNNKIWFIKQRIGNACGTIGLLHALLNTPEPVSQFRPGSWLQQFQASCPASLDPVAKAEILEADDTIASLHDKATSSEQNSTDRGRLEDQLVTHFIAFVRDNNNTLYELDGRKAGPVPHGTTSATTLLPDAIRVIKEFMARDPTEVRFTILALAPKVE